jgi:predicted transcriptional regulator
MSRSNKARIRSLIFAIPGVHMRQIQRVLGLSFSSVRYNVYTLKKGGEVLDWSESGRSRLFPPELRESDRIVYSHLRNHRSRKILRAFTQKEKLTNRELSEVTGFAKSTLSESVHRLMEAEILTTSFSLDGRVGYQLKDPERLLPMIRAADQTVLEEATDRFIELWDF